MYAELLMSSAKELPLSLQVCKKLENDIVFGIFPPGTKLDENELCERYEVSRTPIREALKLLASEGLIEIRPRRGAIVPSLDPLTLCEMFEVMAELESMCARLAARRISDKDKIALQKAHENCQDFLNTNDPENYYEANKDFHFLIYKSSQNKFLIEQATSLHKRLHPYRRLQLRVKNRMTNSFNEHEAIVNAILEGNEDKAAKAIRAHVVIQGEKFTDFLSSIKTLES